MSDTTRAMPPFDRADPNRPDMAGRAPAEGRGDWDDPFAQSRVHGHGELPMAPTPPADPDAALFPRQPMPRPASPRRAPPPTGSGGVLGWVGAALVYSGAALVGASIYQGKRTREAESDHPPIGRFMESDGATLHYVDLGEGPPVVLLHGVGSTLDDWFVSGVLDHLLPHHRIIAIDRPGYGYSSRPGGVHWTPERQARAFARMLHRLGAHQATVVAHSFGVLPAMALALQHPSFVRNLVLVGGVYMPGSFLGRLSRTVPSVPLLGPLARGSVSPSLARAALPSLIRTMFEPQPVTRAFRERFSMDFATRPGQLRAAADDLAEIDRATRRFLPHHRELDIPVAVVTGSGDAIFDPDLQSRPFAAAVPGASLVVVPAGGHLVHHTSPGLVAEVILDTAAGRLQPSDLGPPPDLRAGPLDVEPGPTLSPSAEDALARRERELAERERALAERERAAAAREHASNDEAPSRAAEGGSGLAGNDARSSRSRAARSGVAPATVTGREDDEDGPVSAAAVGEPASAGAPPPTGAVGPANSPPAGGLEDPEPDGGDDASAGDGATDADGDGNAAPKRRRARSRRKAG